MATITGTNLAEILTSGAGADRINALGGDDTLVGNDGNDTLDGGTGNDSMKGGAGNDFYFVNAALDKVVEVAAQGTDTVSSSVTFTLPVNVEKLILTGGANINGTGNTLANTLTGNTGANSLKGLGGADTLVGNGGNDTLDGGTSVDSMKGGTGDDIYIADAAADKAIELAAQGSDTVRSSAPTFTLGVNVEKLVLTGGASASISGTGNALGNTLTGNLGANQLNGLGGNDTLVGGGGTDTLDGGTGNDSMMGGAGNDLYFVNAALDKVVELVAQGTDTVNSTVTYTLGLNVEKLTLTGGSNISGTGNTLNNTLTGNTGANNLSGLGGADTLDGGTGADSLVGGAGNDVLVWDALDAKVDGGADTDTLSVTGVTALDLTAVSDTKIVDVEVVNLAGTNVLTLNAADVLAISSTTDTLRVDGGAGDVVNAGAGWTQIGNTTINAQDYAQYTQDGATLQVDLDIDRSGIAPLAGFSLSMLDGTNGFSLAGTGGQSGRSVASAGDVNDDGFEDLIIGAPFASPDGGPNTGAAYVVYGNGLGFAATVELSDLNGVNGYRLDGVALNDAAGTSVASAGDLNGDGYADLIIGADGADGASGSSYVVFGGIDFGSSLDLSALNGTNGFRMDGFAAGSYSGDSVASVGDVNGDGFDDIIVGAYRSDPGGNTNAGESYVVFGKASGFASGLELSALDGTNGFRLTGSSYSGVAVASAGDVNGDGIGDLVIGGVGVTYVVYGSASGFASAFGLSALDGTNGFRLNPIDSGDYMGPSAASAGDVNGDGYADLIIDASGADVNGNLNAGETYVVFGGSALGADIDLSALDGTNGFRLDGTDAYDRSGYSVASAGDVNGDGFDDLIIGALLADPGGKLSAGEVYLVFGSASGFGSSLALSALDGTNGFRLDGIDAGDRTGLSVAPAGDINGDGYADVVIGAPYAGYQAGVTYVFYGSDLTGNVDQQGTAGNDSLTGTAAADVFVAGRGNDTMTGGGGADVFRGGAGDDRIAIGSTGFADVDGGSGEDTLALNGFSLDLTQLADGELTGVEVVDLTAGDNTLILDELEVVNLSDTSNTLRVIGGTGDAVAAAVVPGTGLWTQGDDIEIDGQTYAVYTKGAATLQVHLGVDRSGIDAYVSEIELSSLDGANGFQLSGAANGDYAGRSVASAGDVNGDGYDDLLVGARGYGAYAGAAYVVFGQASGFASNLTLSGLDGTSGFQLTGEANYDYAGISVSSAGDVNGDGFDDLLVGADRYGASNSGAAYVVFGKASGFASNLALSGLDGTSGFQLTGETSVDYAGRSVSAAGDVNGDGFDDLLVGAQNYSAYNNGVAYVVFGKASGFASNLALSTLDGTSGFQLTGEGHYDYAGISVASAGDVNGDGFDDLLVGANRYGAPNNGAAYVVFGAASGFASNLALSGLDGTSGFQITGEANYDFAGRSVASAGDVNGDGYDDLLVGAYGYGAPSKGAAYVVFGKASGFASNLSLSTLDGTSGFQLTGEAVADQAGSSVASAGDVNGDGYDDLLVGAYGYGASNNGAAYVVFGAASGFASNLALSALDGTSGFQLTGEAVADQVGSSVASAGDVNGDGFADLVIGAFGADPNGDSSGASYVVYGRDFNDVVDFLGTAGANTLTGTGAAEAFVAGRGNDTLTGGGGADVFRGGAGDDLIQVTDALFLDVDGGSGIDTLALTGDGVTLDLTLIANSKVTGIEIVDLDDGSGGNTLTLALGDVLDLSDTSNTLTVEGDGDDTVTVADGSWTDGGEVAGYHFYTLGAATLRIDADITSVTITLV